MASTADAPPLDRPIRAKLGRDDWTLRILIGLVALYLLVTLALPLYAILAKSATVYDFRFAEIGIERGAPGTWEDLGTAEDWVGRLPAPVNDGRSPTARTRLPASEMFPKDQFEEGVTLRFHDRSATGGLLLHGGILSEPGGSVEVRAENLRKLLIRPAGAVGLRNYVEYFTTPALRRSIGNSLFIAGVTTVITVTSAFLFAYALTRSCMPAKGLFKMIAMVPILVPSLLPGIALVYLFGKQGMLKALLFGSSIYGPIGIVTASVFYTFPHALVIILVALSLADARLYEAAIALRASRRKTFLTVTLPGARYGLISAAFVVFNLVITDFGVPKVIGGQYNVLALDIYKQVVGQQNFEMGAVVSVVLLIPAVVAFAVDRLVQRRQVALLSARAVPYEPKPSRRFDLTMLAVCVVISIFILGLLSMCQFAALVTYWPYDLSLSLKNYNFNLVDGGGWASYLNSIRMAFMVALIGTAIVFVGAYLVEKARGLAAGRTAVQFLAMMPMAVPGMVLGLAYVFFFNDPANPLYAIYGTLAILVICTITHFYTVAHLTATTALKQMDPEFEAVSASLKQPVTKMFRTVTVPVCLPAILDIAIYLFVNAMTTVSAVVFLYSPDTTLASVAVLNMDDAGDIAPAAAMGMMIFYTNVAARLLHTGVSGRLLRRTQAWRSRGT
ncbi:MAG: putative 2-aminoethylphosphonate ABC transporter permease subunit [Alphaproteobacteria bacterium]